VHLARAQQDDETDRTSDPMQLHALLLDSCDEGGTGSSFDETGAVRIRSDRPRLRRHEPAGRWDGILSEFAPER
jgi:hypothetical protein